MFDARDLEPKQVRHSFQFGRLLITQQRGGQSDTVGCYSGLKSMQLKDGAYYFNGIFAPVYDYAGNVDLDKCY